MAKTILKNTNQETIIKISEIGAETIDLSADIVAATQELDGATQTVNIAGVRWTGAVGCTITISRNSVPVLTLAGESATGFDFNSCGFVDSVENTSDITATIAGAEGQVYLILRKVSGYATKVENATFGSYDDPTQVGA